LLPVPVPDPHPLQTYSRDVLNALPKFFSAPIVGLNGR
jgi:hypothetical protein